MNLEREALSILRKTPAATSSEIAAHIFKVRPNARGRVEVDERQREAMRAAIRNLTAIPRHGPDGKPAR